MLREKKPIRSYHGEQFRTNPTNKKHLAEDFGHRCAYCDDLEDVDGNIIFKGSKMWAMSDEDIDEARRDWMDIKAVLTHGVQLTIGEDGRTYNNFPGVADARRVHLRPHGAKSFYVNADGSSWGNGRISDTELLPDGRRMTRQSYWLNNSFIREIVRDLIDID